MTHPISKESLTAYVLDELEEDAKKEIELALESDEQLRDQLDVLRSIAKNAWQDLDDAPAEMTSASDEQRKKIRQKLEEATYEPGEPEKRGGLFDMTDSQDAPVDFGDRSASLLGPDENGSDLFALKGEQPKEPAKTSLVGQRSEDSVLFSQRNLQNAVNEKSENTESRKDDTSGLVDIRALAAVTAGKNGDDTDVGLELATGGFAPVLTPQIKKRKPGLVIALVGAGLLCVILVTVVMNMMFAGKTAEIAQLDAKLEQLNAQIAQQQAGNGTADTPETAALLEEIARLKAEKSAGMKKKRRKAKAQKSLAAAPDAKEPSPKASTPAASGESAAPTGPKKPTDDDLDDLLGGATEAPGSAKRKSDLPDSLTKNQVKLGLNKVASKVKKCGKGHAGTLRMNVVINGSTGKVRSTTAIGQFKDTPTGDCAERAAKGARFHAFKKKTLSVTFPFQL